MERENKKILLNMAAAAAFVLAVFLFWNAVFKEWETTQKTEIVSKRNARIETYYHGNGKYKTVSYASLAPDTLIRTKYGKKKISEIMVGELVWTMDNEIKKLELSKVMKVANSSINNYGNRYYKISFLDTRSHSVSEVRATYNHVFYANGKLVQAKDLKKRDRLIGPLLQEIITTSIAIEANNIDNVWDLEVAKNHNFFANDVLVHNAGENLTQIHYRWRNDDGNEASASWGANEDTATSSIKIGETKRLRIEVSNEGTASSSQMYILQYGTASTTGFAIKNDWYIVPASGSCGYSAFCIANSSLTEGSATTNVGSGLTDENTTFVAGLQKESNATTTHISLDTVNFTEIEYSFQPTSYAMEGMTYFFRLATTTGTAFPGGLDTYTIMPQLTMSNPKPIYRSVGKANADVQKGSATTTLSIWDSIATFSSAMPNRVGVGDAIQYDSDNNASIDSIAFIWKRFSSTQYLLQTPLGRIATSTFATTTVIADEDWALYRAYTSLFVAEGGTENTSIAAAVRNFDTWSGGRNITATSSNEIWNIAGYADGADTSSVVISGWVMSTSTYLRIYTPTSTAEVGASQRHNGTWGTGYRLQVSDVTGIVRPNNNFIRIDGLSMKNTGNGRAIIFSSISEAGEIYVSNNFGWATYASSLLDTFDIFSVASTYYYVWNNIGINDSVAGTAEAFFLNDADVIAYFYNNTGIASAGSAFRRNAGTGRLVNNLGYAATSSIAFYGTWVDVHNNSSNDATADDWNGLNNNINQTFTFIDSANQDYRLSSSDAGAKDFGLSISASSTLAISFNTDINGQSRPYNSTWDIGADELGRGLDQIHYRWRNDDGSETAATWGRNEDTATSSPNVGTVVRLRAEVANPGNASSSQMFLLQYGTGSNPQSGTWTTVPDSSNCSTSPFCMNASSLTESSATTNVSSGLTDAETTFVAGLQKETTATTTHISLPLNNFTEIEHAFKITRYAYNNTAYYFRLATTTGVGDANQLLTYTVTPQLTTAVGTTNINQIHYRWRNDDGTETTANWGVAEDTATTTVGLSKTMRLRLEPSNQGTASSSQMYILQYGTGSDPTTGTWTIIPNSSNCGSAPFCMTSSSLTEDSATTNVSSGLTDAQTNFISGSQKETTATTTHISLTIESFTELEYAFQVTSSASNGTTYYFRLATTTGDGTANTLTNYSQTPALRTIVGVPTNLAATTAGSGQINLTWDQMTSATGYDIYRSTNNSTFTIISTSPVVSSGSTTSYSDTGLNSGTIYYYKILSIESGGSSALSSSVNATTLTATSSTTNPGGLGLPINAFQAPKTPVTGFQVIINQGQDKTNSREVALTLIGSKDIKKMAVSNYPDLKDAGIEPFQDLKLWDLCSKAQNTQKQKTCPDSTYTVYAKFYTLYGQSSSVIHDSIILENIAQALADKQPSPAEEGLDSDNDGLSDQEEDYYGTDRKNKDTDNDGYMDKEEIDTNHDPLNPPLTRLNNALIKRLKGRIILQVQKKGEAYYIHPVSGQRYYLRNGATAYEIMRKLGLGITNKDLQKIPTTINNQQSTIDKKLVNRLKGRILLQVQQHGEAWYVNPTDGKRYYLKDGETAYEIMRKMGLGITNANLQQIPYASSQ